MSIKFNEAFFQELGQSAGVTGLVMKAAEQVAAAARASAPVDSGDYRDSIHTALKHQDRSVALVIADDPKTMLIESKTGNLARALKAAKKGG
jgi:hypothetical protein